MANDASALGNIKHVVVLMFENRSFDHILGAMPGVDGVLDGNGAIKPEMYNTMDPLTPPSGDLNPKHFLQPIVPNVGPLPYESNLPYDPAILQPPNAEMRIMTHDFSHALGNGMLHDVFGPGTKGFEQCKPIGEPEQTFPAANSGFLTAPKSINGRTTINGLGALTYFEWKSMNVFHTLAENFLVFDSWHCDMPGHTAPNRAFMHCATTGDLGIDDDDSNGAQTMVNRTTIFERLQAQGKTWKMYWPGSNCDTDFLNETVCAQAYNPNAPNPDAQTNVTQVPMENFFQDVETGNLPFYSFVMCWHFDDKLYGDSSMHPASSVRPGENLLAAVYNALRGSPHWEDTLLIVNFDENGGIYDHRPLPTATPPDFDPSWSQKPPVSNYYSSITATNYTFDFTSLGVRVPVMFISPWLQNGICSEAYQNTSILRFLQDQLPLIDSESQYLTQRDRAAPTFAPVFDWAKFGLKSARTDCPVEVAPYPESPQLLGASHASPAVPPAPYMVDKTKLYVGALPGHADSGKSITRDFPTVGALVAYAAERYAAANAVRQAKQSP